MCLFAMFSVWWGIWAIFDALVATLLAQHCTIIICLHIVSMLFFFIYQSMVGHVCHNWCIGYTISATLSCNSRTLCLCLIVVSVNFRLRRGILAIFAVLVATASAQQYDASVCTPFTPGANGLFFSLLFCFRFFFGGGVVWCFFGIFGLFYCFA